MFSKKKTVYTTIIILVFCFFALCGLSNYREEQLAVTMASRQLNSTLENVSSTVETAKIKEIISSKEEANPYYSLLKMQLRQSCADSGLADIYIVAKTTDNKWRYIADSREASSPLFHRLGQEENSVPVVWEKAIRGTRIEPELTRGDRGTIISSYKQLKDEKGQIYAFIAGEYDASQISEYIYVTLYVQVGIILFAIVIIGWIWRRAIRWKIV